MSGTEPHMPEQTKTTEQYRTEYRAGWAYSRRGGSLSRADDRRLTDSNAWMDGYLDYAAGRPMWHLAECTAHHNGPGGCRTA